jgi:hypothetical protein
VAPGHQRGTAAVVIQLAIDMSVENLKARPGEASAGSLAPGSGGSRLPVGCGGRTS